MLVRLKRDWFCGEDEDNGERMEIDGKRIVVLFLVLGDEGEGVGFIFVFSSHLRTERTLNI
jgi:hypothetical protein